MVISETKDKEIKDRLRTLINERGGNVSKFSRDIKVSSAYFASELNSDDKGVSSTILKALTTINVNKNGLLTGKGSMFFGEMGNYDDAISRAEIAEAKIEELEKRLELIEYHSKELKQMILTQSQTTLK